MAHGIAILDLAMNRHGFEPVTVPCQMNRTDPANGFLKAHKSNSPIGILNHAYGRGARRIYWRGLWFLGFTEKDADQIGNVSW